MTPSTASKKPASKTTKAAQEALRHIDASIDPKNLDVYPKDAIQEAQEALRGLVSMPASLQEAQRHIDKALSHLATYEAQEVAQDLTQQDAQAMLELDHIDKALSHLDHAQEALRHWLTA